MPPGCKRPGGRVPGRLRRLLRLRQRPHAVSFDPESEECEIAYLNLRPRRIDARGMMCSALALTVGSNWSVGGVELGRSCGVSFPPEFLRLR